MDASFTAMATSVEFPIGFDNEATTHLPSEENYLNLVEYLQAILSRPLSPDPGVDMTSQIEGSDYLPDIDERYDLDTMKEGPLEPNLSGDTATTTGSMTSRAFEETYLVPTYTLARLDSRGVDQINSAQQYSSARPRNAHHTTSLSGFTVHKCADGPTRPIFDPFQLPIDGLIRGLELPSTKSPLDHPAQTRINTSNPLPSENLAHLSSSSPQISEPLKTTVTSSQCPSSISCPTRSGVKKSKSTLSTTGVTDIVSSNPKAEASDGLAAPPTHTIGGIPLPKISEVIGDLAAKYQKINAGQVRRRRKAPEGGFDDLIHNFSSGTSNSSPCSTSAGRSPSIRPSKARKCLDGSRSPG